MKKFLSVVLMLAILVSMTTLLSACGEEKRSSKKEGKDTETVETVPAGTEDTSNSVAITGSLDADIKAVQIGTMGEVTALVFGDGGMYYKDADSGKYGIMSFDGAFDTGAKYGVVNNEGVCFAVRAAAIKDANDIKDVNKTALVNGKGKEIIPASYAAYSVLNEKFVQVFTVTGVTTNEDEAILTYANDRIDDYVNSDGTMYKGTWEIFNLETGKKIPGAKGTSLDYVSAYGGIVYYNDENYNKMIFTEDGTQLDSSVKVFENGTYSVEGRDGGVYTSKGETLFTYSLTSYIPDSSSGDYYIASMYSDSKKTYVVMDNTGTVVSSVFDDYITVYGDIVECNDKIYNLDGDNIIEGEFTSLIRTDAFNKAYYVYDDNDVYTMFDRNGNIVFQETDGGDIFVNTSDFVTNKDVNDDTYSYCHKYGDYTIKGRGVGPWLAKVETANYHYDLVEVIGGETLLTGYERYDVNNTSKGVFVHAKYNGGYDVFQIIAGDMVVNVTEKKENLVDELIQAFENEGIAVAVNKETGEMSMDASVLFGGDSAELTADGKKFLDKFTKAYTSIVFSDKYSGFVTRTMVEGHIAPVAGVSYESGLPLSVDRAENVKAYCLTVKTGVDSKTLDVALDAIGYSNTKPVYDASGNVDMDASRRVSFRIMINVEEQ